MAAIFLVEVISAITACVVFCFVDGAISSFEAVFCDEGGLALSSLPVPFSLRVVSPLCSYGGLLEEAFETLELEVAIFVDGAGSSFEAVWCDEGMALLLSFTFSQRGFSSISSEGGLMDEALETFELVVAILSFSCSSED